MTDTNPNQALLDVIAKAYKQGCLDSGTVAPAYRVEQIQRNLYIEYNLLHQEELLYGSNYY